MHFLRAGPRIFQRMPTEDSGFVTRGSVPTGTLAISVGTRSLSDDSVADGKLRRTQHFINGGLGKPVERRSFQKMARILVEVRRQRKRRELRKAVASGLSARDLATWLQAVALGLPST